MCRNGPRRDGAALIIRIAAGGGGVLREVLRKRQPHKAEPGHANAHDEAAAQRAAAGARAAHRPHMGFA